MVAGSQSAIKPVNHHIRPAALRATQKTPNSVTNVASTAGWLQSCRRRIDGVGLGKCCERLHNFVDVMIGDDFAMRDLGDFFQHVGPGGAANGFGGGTLDEHRGFERGAGLLAGKRDFVLAGLLRR